MSKHKGEMYSKQKKGGENAETITEFCCTKRGNTESGGSMVAGACFNVHLPALKYLQHYWLIGREPGLVVMGRDSCSKGCEFESRHRILDGHFFTHLFVVKFVMCD